MKKTISFVFCFLFSLTAVSAVLAGPLEKKDTVNSGLLDTFRTSAGFSADTNGTSLSIIVATIIQGFLSLLGVIFIILIIMAGYNWMTAAGDESKVTKAKDTIYKAIIGLIIIVAAYSITYFVFSAMPWDGKGSAGNSSYLP